MKAAALARRPDTAPRGCGNLMLCWQQHARLRASQVKLLGGEFDFEATHKAMAQDFGQAIAALSGESALLSAGRVVPLYPVQCRSCSSCGVVQKRSHRDEYVVVAVVLAPQSLYFLQGSVVCKACKDRDGRRLRTNVFLDDIRRVAPDLLQLSVWERGAGGGRWPTLISLDYAWFITDVFRDTFCIKVCQCRSAA